jgi:hypothetical protein
VNQGSLYPALQRLEQRGMITSEWQTTENNRHEFLIDLTGLISPKTFATRRDRFVAMLFGRRSPS